MKKPRVKSLLLFLLMLVFAVAAAAQDSAECAVSEPPRLLGLRLGMTPPEVRSVFGRDLRVRVKTEGDRTFFQNYVKNKPPARLSGVKALYLRFLDGRLYQIEVFYDELSNAPTLETFAARLSSEMNFPASVDWNFADNKASLDCGAFTVVADQPVNPRVELTDTARLAEAVARRKKSD